MIWLKLGIVAIIIALAVVLMFFVIGYLSYLAYCAIGEEDYTAKRRHKRWEEKKNGAKH